MKNDNYRKVFLKLSYFAILFSFCIYLVSLQGCEKQAENSGDLTSFSKKVTCEGCHTDAEALQTLATPEPPPSNSGTG